MSQFVSFLNFPVEHASLCNNGFLKPNPYVELSVDNRSNRKTDVIKHTHLPKWNEDFTVLVSNFVTPFNALYNDFSLLSQVTPNSVLEFKVYDHSSFHKDAFIGGATIFLNEILRHYNGRCENLELSMDLLNNKKIRQWPIQNGELVAILNGLNVDMSQVPIPNGNGAASGDMQSDCTNGGPPAVIQGNQSSILRTGIRARMRLCSNPVQLPNSPQPNTNAINAAINNYNMNGSPSASGGAMSQNALHPGNPISASTGAIRRNSGNTWESQQQQSQIQHQRVAIPNMNGTNQRIIQNVAPGPSGDQMSQGAAGAAALPDGMSPSPVAHSGAVNVPNGAGNPVPVSSASDQQMQTQSDDEPLPAGWEIRFDQYGRR